MKKIHRFIEEYKIENKQIGIKDPSLLHQWKNVLKFKNGERIILSNKNEDILAEIKSLNKNLCELKVIEKYQNNNKVKRKVHLFLAILKKENFELAIQKSTELGIESITPIITERTIKTGLNFERLKKITKEASELSGRNTIPIINKTIIYPEIFEKNKNQKTIIFDTRGEKIKEIGDEEINIIIGPEGGFTENEIKIAKENDTITASLSPLTLRGETAAVVASYLTTNI
jgi:16S rRNA (uracil1498-N3)-methyltransferase